MGTFLKDRPSRAGGFVDKKFGVVEELLTERIDMVLGSKFYSKGRLNRMHKSIPART